MRVSAGILVLCCAGSALGTPVIRTRLLSNFSISSLSLELAEGIAAHNQTSYFPFIEYISQQSVQTDAIAYAHGMQWITDNELLTPSAQALLRLEMSVRTFAPAVEAQHQLYVHTIVPELRNMRTFDDSCLVWAQFKDKQACSIEALQALLDSEAFYGTTYVEDAQVEPRVLALDHTFKPDTLSANAAKLVVLYADVHAQEFAAFHEHLKMLAQSGDVQYVLRYGPQAHTASDALVLAGYGVELVLKSTEYKVTDDRDLGLNVSRKSEKMHEQNSEAQLFATETEPIIRGLTEPQLEMLGVQAMQMIASADSDKLGVMQRLAQDLPRYAHLLAELPVNSTLANEIGDASYTRDSILVNGLRLSDNTLDPFHIMDHLRSENAIIEGLQTAGLSQHQALGLLLFEDTHESVALSFDMRDHLKQNTILWLNDLETDKRYTGWPSDISLLQHTNRGRMQPLRKNIVQSVFALDLAEPESWITVFEDIMSSVEHGMPMQFGLVPLIDFDSTSVSSQMAKFVLYLRRAFNRREWHAFMRRTLIAHLRGRSDSTFVESVRLAYAKYTAVHKTKDQEEPFAWDDIMGGHEWLATRWQAMVEYCKRLDLSSTTTPASGIVFVNGVQVSLAGNYQQRLYTEFQQQTLRVARSLRDGLLAEDANIQDHVYGSSMRARSSLIEATDESPLRFLDLSAEAVQQWIDNDIYYLSNSSDSDSFVSVWVIGDYTTQNVRGVASEALRAAGEEHTMRVALVHVPLVNEQSVDRAQGEEEDDDQDVDAPQVLFQLASAQHGVSEASKVLGFVSALLNDPEAAKAHASDRLAQLAEPAGDMADDAEQTFMRTSHVLSGLGALPALRDACLVAVNGRVLPQITSETITSDTFVLLSRYERRERIDAMSRALVSSGIESDANVLLKATAITEHGKTLFGSSGVFQQKAPLERRRLTEQSMFQFGDTSNARFRVQCVVDPLSEHAQKWMPMLQTLLTLPSVSLELWLNPQLKIKELPIRRFYRYLWPHALEFDSSGAVTGPAVEFNGVPADPLLTLGMDVPASWLVTATDSVHDLDNIRLSSVRSDISATFRLMHILVEGHLMDTHSRKPARGLEVRLGTVDDAAMTDTIVMANLGYLQLKAGPGVWQFSVRPGRSADIYRIDHIGSDGWNYSAAKQATEEDKRPVLVTSFSGTTVFPLVSKRPGRESDDVLDTAASPQATASSGIWGKLKGSLGAPAPHFDVFAVASGHLYERLMSIMMLSVRSNTKSTIKFWLIENFLSPSFKAFVPLMAAEFDFDYEFVTYKWPHWLHHETEKQRTIWGYKILFLDVLFPLSLDRVIFVDADQIVRADLQELKDMDLEGAPYGFTPFCDDRPEIDGFRFWKHGWWRDHLRGKPYHISALFVVDLKRFRQLAAGDRMRGQYQALSQDGGSLANLDQDLPNNMQHVVPIHSLPQEWLWCETWCGDNGLQRAKTIDLCNNPMTKEPKLERARRLLPEWSVFDKQVAEFTRKLAEKGKVEGKVIADAVAVNVDEHVEDSVSKDVDGGTKGRMLGVSAISKRGRPLHRLPVLTAVKDHSPHTTVRYKSNKSTRPPEPKITLPVFDLSNIKAMHPGIKIHNPLVDIEIKEKEAASNRQRQVAAGIRQTLLKTRGTHPLPLKKEYLSKREHFLSTHGGIERTPTRKFIQHECHDTKLNLKSAFGISRIFFPLQSNFTMYGEDLSYTTEFNFNRGARDYLELMELLGLYVRFMHSAQSSVRKVYQDDFFLIMKAIRQREKGHRKLMERSDFMQHIMTYLLVCDQPHLAMYLAREYLIKAPVRSLYRWQIARLLNNPRLYLPNLTEISNMEGMEKGTVPVHYNIDVEYRFNLVAQSIHNYYRHNPRITLTDTELIHLIRCFEARKIKSMLRDMLPLVIKRFINGKDMELSEATRIQLFYDSDIMVPKLEDFQVVMRYAHALLESDSVASCLQMLHTVADMPGKPCGDLYGNTQDVARALVLLLESDDARATTKYILHVLGTNDVENVKASDEDNIVLCTWLLDTIARSTLKPHVSRALSKLASLPMNLLSPHEVTSTIEFQKRRGPNMALTWVADNIQMLNAESQSTAFKWLTKILAADLDVIVRFVTLYAKSSPVKCAQFVHVLCRRLWERESDRRHILAAAFSAIAMHKDAEATGVLLVTAAMGPETPVLSPFGPQSIRERSKVVVKLVNRMGSVVQARSVDLMPYLFKVASALGAKNTEQMLWKELLRQGIEPDWRMLQSAISLRTSNRLDYKQTMELIMHVMHVYPIEANGSESALEALPADRSVLYLSILKGLSNCGMTEPFELLAHEMLNSPSLKARTFASLALTWLEMLGHTSTASSSSIRHVWNILKTKAANFVPSSQYDAVIKLDRTHFHAVVEAYVRVGDVSSAWNVIHDEMPQQGFVPELATFYTLVVPLASTSKLWPVGKSVVAKFNVHYPEIVRRAVEDKTNTLIVKALLRQALSDLDEKSVEA
ncbi:killer toxin resistant protein [Coemansia sp. RSA 1972]|nr:killer toxin resistant protein [Coemansia sp. RSA 1972]